MGLQTLLGLRKQGFFSPYRYAEQVIPSDRYAAVEDRFREVEPRMLKVLDAIASAEKIGVSITHDLLHGAAWEEHGTFCTDQTVERANAADAILVGAVGGPQWDNIRVPGGPEMQDGLMRLRKELDTYAGLRPARAWNYLNHFTPFRAGLAETADIMVLREMCGGAMFAEPRGQTTKNGCR